MTNPGGVRRICVMTAVGNVPADSELLTRCKDLLGRVLQSAGVDGVGIWRQDRGGRHLLLLPVGTTARSFVPPLIRGLLDRLGQDQSPVGAPALRPLLSVAQGTVTQTRAGYAGRAIIAASRLLDSAELHDLLIGAPEALFAMIVSDDMYAEAVPAGSGTRPDEGYRKVTVDAPDNLWQGTGWIRAWGPADLEALPEKEKGTSFRNGLLSALAGLADDTDQFGQAGASQSGSTGAETHATADTAHLAAAHSAAEEHSYGAEQSNTEHYMIQEGPGYLEETVVHSGYEGGAGYESGAGHDSAEYHSSSVDHSA